MLRCILQNGAAAVKGDPAVRCQVLKFIQVHVGMRRIDGDSTDVDVVGSGLINFFFSFEYSILQKCYMYNLGSSYSSSPEWL